MLVLRKCTICNIGKSTLSGPCKKHAIPLEGWALETLNMWQDVSLFIFFSVRTVTLLTLMSAVALHLEILTYFFYYFPSKEDLKATCGRSHRHHTCVSPQLLHMVVLSLFLLIWSHPGRGISPLLLLLKLLPFSPKEKCLLEVISVSESWIQKMLYPSLGANLIIGEINMV